MQLEGDTGAAVRQPLRFLRSKGSLREADGSGLLCIRRLSLPRECWWLGAGWPLATISGAQTGAPCCRVTGRDRLWPAPHCLSRDTQIWLKGQLCLVFPGWPSCPLCHALQRPAQCSPAGREAPWAQAPGAQPAVPEVPPRTSRGRPCNVTQNCRGDQNNPGLVCEVSSGSKNIF